MALKIDVVSDIVCPWCFISKRQLQDAMRSFTGPSEIAWHPMQRYPDIPATGAEKKNFLKTMYGNLDGVNQALFHLVEAGRELGIGFDFDRIDRIPNTLNAHRIIYACPRNQQDQLVDNLFSGFFEQGLDISDRDVLISLAEASDFDPAAASAALQDDTTREAVLSEEERLKKMGLSGIPNILLNRRVAVSGTQNTESLVRAFDYALFGIPAKEQSPPVIH